MFPMILRCSNLKKPSNDNRSSITHMRTMVLVYLPTKLGDFGQGQMLGFIFQHHGSHPRVIGCYGTLWSCVNRHPRMFFETVLTVFGGGRGTSNSKPNLVEAFHRNTGCSHMGFVFRISGSKKMVPLYVLINLQITCPYQIPEMIRLSSQPSATYLRVLTISKNNHTNWNNIN